MARMLRFFFVKWLILSLSVLCISPCNADTNWYGFYSCDPRPSNSISDVYKTNVNNTLSILEEKGPPRHGFYKTTVGIEPEKVYGLVQCAGDVSAQNCSQCIKDAAHLALTDCKYTKYFAIWYRWCYVRYSDREAYEGWDGMTLSTSHGNGTDKPSVVSAGMSLIHKLALDAPNQPRLFKTDTVDVGRQGVRYGLAQCIGDLSKDECRKCLSAEVKKFYDNIGNQSSLVVASHSCSFWYDDYQFYFNYSTATDGYSDIPDTGAAALTSTVLIGITSSIVAATTSLLFLYLF